MKTKQIKEMLDKLLESIEEEDVSISLFSNFYQNEEELKLFSDEDKEVIKKILHQVVEDSKRHKLVVKEIMTHLAKEYNGK